MGKPQAREGRPALRVMRKSKELIGEHPAWLRAVRRAQRIGPRCGPVIITGPTGSGKTEIARIIHAYSGCQGPPVVVNAATIRPELAESELFGTAKGAYTGAVARMGLFETAKNTTLFIDEIAELAPEVQAKILLTVESGILRRLGSTEEIGVETRIIVATHADLSAAGFRQDLIGRLGCYRIDLPPLHERGRDVLLFAAHFMEEEPDLSGFVLDLTKPDVQQALMGHTWPLGVREVKNVLCQASLEVEDEDDDPEITAKMIRVVIGSGAAVADAVQEEGGAAGEAESGVESGGQGAECGWMPLVEYAERIGLRSDRPLKRAAVDGGTYHGVPFRAEVRPMLNARGQIRSMWAIKLPGPIGLRS